MVKKTAKINKFKLIAVRCFFNEIINSKTFDKLQIFKTYENQN